jgi:flagellar protein FlaG
MSVGSVGYNPVSPIPLPADIRGAVLKHEDSVFQHGAVLKHEDSASQPEPKEKPQVIHSTAQDLQRAFSRRLQFVVDQSSKQVIVKVIDKETDKVMKELPPEELQRLHRNIKEAIGLLYDELV